MAENPSMITLIATMFGYRAVIQKIDPPWMPAPSVLGQILANLEKNPKMAQAPEKDPA